MLDSKDSLIEKLFEIAESGDVVLFKASRGMKLEEVFEIIYEKKYS